MLLIFGQYLDKRLIASMCSVGNPQSFFMQLVRLPFCLAVILIRDDFRQKYWEIYRQAAKSQAQVEEDFTEGLLQPPVFNLIATPFGNSVQVTLN